MKPFQSGALSLVLCAALLLGASAADSRRHLVQAPAGARTIPSQARMMAHSQVLLLFLSAKLCTHIAMCIVALPHRLS